MKIALIGPTGFVGSRVLEEASGRGHSVSAISRNPDRVPSRKGVKAVRADMLERKEAAAAFVDHDIVVSCFNVGHHPAPGQNIYKDTIDGVVNIIRATKAAGVSRLLFVGGAGALYAAPGIQLIDQFDDIGRGEVSGSDFPERLVEMMPPEFAGWADLFTEDVRHEHVLPFVHALMFFEHDQTYDWSFFSPPPGLHPGARKGRYALGSNMVPMVGGRFGGLSLADAGLAIVDEIEKPQHNRQHWTAYDPD